MGREDFGPFLAVELRIKERGEVFNLGKIKVAKDWKPRQKIMEGIKRTNIGGEPNPHHSKQRHLKQIKQSFTYG